MFIPVNSVVVSDSLYFVYSKLYLLVKDGHEWGALAMDSGFCPRSSKAGGSTAGRRDKYISRIYDDKMLSSPG